MSNEVIVKDPPHLNNAAAQSWCVDNHEINVILLTLMLQQGSVAVHLRSSRIFMALLEIYYLVYWWKNFGNRWTSDKGNAKNRVAPFFLDMV